MKEQDLPCGLAPEGSTIPIASASPETTSPLIGQAAIRGLVLSLQMAQLPPIKQFSILQEAHKANITALDPEARDYLERQLNALHDFCKLD